jgi:hypothetical protein
LIVENAIGQCTMQLPVGITVFLVAVLVAVLAIAVVLTSWQVAVIAWSFWSYHRDIRRIDLGHEYRCDQGTFVRKEQSWVAEVNHDGIRLSVDVRDDHGAPDATFLRRLPGIVARLGELERAARDGVSEVTDDYILDSLLSPVRREDDYEFALGFSPKEENYEMSIYVNFKDDRVIGWLGVD